jgi:hypothetical protein
VDELIKKLEASGDGCYIGHLFMGALGYADDFTLLAPTAQGLQRMLNVCEEFGIEYDVVFNSPKTVCILLSKSKKVRHPELTLNGQVLKWEDTINHLGNHISDDFKDNCDIRHKKYDLISRINSLAYNFKYVSCDVMKMLYRSNCCAFYGSQTLDLSSNGIQELEVSWRKGARKVLGLPYKTRSDLVPYVIDQKQLHVQFHERFVKMMRSVMASSNEHMKMLINISVNAENQGFFGKNVLFLNNCYNMSIMERQDIPAMACRDDLKVCADIIKELLSVRDNMSSLDVFNANELQEFTKWICTY